MPTYVYECKKCEKVFEVEQRITADPLTDCECGAKGSLRRLIQPTAVMFKGSGFHINDYAGASKAAETPSAEPAKPTTETEPTSTAPAAPTPEPAAPAKDAPPG